MNAPTGIELKKLRESKGITLERAAQDTCMRAAVLGDLEESGHGEDLPAVYDRLSLSMYARYLGVDMETTRRATSPPEAIRLAPLGVRIRRMGRAIKAPRLDPAQRNRLLTIAKTTSAVVVVVLAVGLWSLNAKLDRLNLDERPIHGVAVDRASAESPPPGGEAVPLTITGETVSLDSPYVPVVDNSPGLNLTSSGHVSLE
jgi:cytoskeletal protein RodZ